MMTDYDSISEDCRPCRFKERSLKGRCEHKRASSKRHKIAETIMNRVEEAVARLLQLPESGKPLG